MKKYLFLLSTIVLLGLLSNCNDDDTPGKENEEEIIDLVTLTFTPSGGGTPLVITATDPDGSGVADLAPDSEISLDASTTYTLTIKLENSEEDENMTEEVEEEGDEHMFFFSFTTDVFGNPAGNGNIDNRGDAMNYNDTDGDGEPIGLSTDWTTGSGAVSSGSFRVVLKHQPGIKSSTSTSQDGESDIDIEWVLNVNVSG